jgi:hypothetical protein
MGYSEPWLKPHLTGDLSGRGTPIADGYTVSVSPKGYGACTSSEKGGVYTHRNFKLLLCVDSAQFLGPDDPDHLTHEFFHALQAAYPATRSNLTARRLEEWVIEGTATAAMGSDETTLVATKMNRSLEYDPRKIHIGLRNPGTRSDVFEYETQDLWVYAGRTRGNADIGPLSIVFALGGNNAAADMVFKSLYGAALPDMYWEWVKNQAYEKNERFADAQGANEALGPGCKLETANGETVDPSTIGDFNTVVSPSGWSGKLGPLSTKVVRFRLPSTPETRNWKKFAFFGLNQLGDDVRYKVYNYDGASPCGGSIPDGLRPLDNLRVATDYYILVSNVTSDKEIEVLLSGDLFETY